MKKISIGIDGGGTGSTFTFLETETGKRTSINGPSIQLREMELETAASRIIQTIDNHFHAENLRIEHITAGIAGAGVSLNHDLLVAELESALQCRAFVISDAEAAWYAAFGSDKSGLLLINGTGSVMVSGSEKGLKLYGGYGPGSHEILSGRELGRQALRYLGEQLDAGNQSGAFLTDLMDAAKITNRLSLLDFIRNNPSKAAGLAPVVLKHASNQQPEALQIVQHELNLLENQLKNISQRESHPSIALHGGLFQNNWLKIRVTDIVVKSFGDKSVIFDLPAVSDSLAGVTDTIRLKRIRF